MDLSFVLFAVVAFLAVVLALEGLYNMWASTRSPEARRIADRLLALSGEVHTTMSLERAKQTQRLPQLNALLKRVGFGARVTRFVHASATTASPVEIILLSAALGVGGFMLPGLLGKPQIFG